MIKIIFEYTVFFVLALLLITQVILPSFVSSMSYWWFFKKRVTNDKIQINSLDELDEEVDASVVQMKETKEKVEKAADKVAAMKNKTKQ